jgi:hypothetical protein
MKQGQYVKIVRFGLIGDAQDGDSYRHIIFEDLSNGKKADYIVYRKKKPLLWADIEELERGKQVPPRKGYVARFNGLDLVVLGDESLEEAFTAQKWKLNIHKQISYSDAEKLRQETKGYCTNETNPGAIEISWKVISPNAKMVRFRYYEGKGQFSWSKWYQIV